AMARKDLLAVIREEKLVSPRDLDRVERERAAEGKTLWAALTEERLLSDDELFFLLAPRFVGAVAADDLLRQAELPHALRGRFGREEAERLGLFPVELEGARATVVMVDPTDEASLREFCRRSQIKEARALLGRRALVEQAIERGLAPATVEIDPSLRAE